MRVITELPAPGEMWARWAAFAAAFGALGYDDVWTVTAGGAHHDDGGGNWAHLALVEDGRAVLYGYDHEYSETVDADPPIDLLAEAPDWLPWGELTRLQGDDELGYVFWFTAGDWHRVAYPDGVDDGLTSTVAEALDDAAAVTQLEELIFQWSEYDVDGERPAVAEAASWLLRMAHEQAVDAPAVAALVARVTEREVDLATGVLIARRAGIADGTTPPRTPAGSRPARRRIRKLSDGAHDRLVWAAMRETAELSRPTPVPTGELGALASWLRTNSTEGDGRTSLLFYADDNSTSAHAGEHPPRDNGGFATFREMGELVRRLREAEADPVRGRWLFLRVETTAGDVTVERCYDSWPAWWTDNGVSGPWRSNLRVEIDKRGRQWRPGWAELLDPGVAYRIS